MLSVSTHAILPSYRSSKSTLNVSSLPSTWSRFTSGAMYPQSSGTKYCCPSNCPAVMSLGFSEEKFGISEVSHGCSTSRSTQSLYR